MTAELKVYLRAASWADWRAGLRADTMVGPKVALTVESRAASTVCLTE